MFGGTLAPEATQVCSKPTKSHGAVVSTNAKVLHFYKNGLFSRDEGNEQGIWNVEKATATKLHDPQCNCMCSTYYMMVKCQCTSYDSRASFCSFSPSQFNDVLYLHTC